MLGLNDYILIVSQTNKVGFLQISNTGNLVLQPDIQEATKFTDEDLACTYLNMSRQRFDVPLVAIGVSALLFDKNPRRVK